VSGGLFGDVFADLILDLIQGGQEERDPVEIVQKICEMQPTAYKQCVLLIALCCLWRPISSCFP
jgi:hypothetical protein